MREVAVLCSDPRGPYPAMGVDCYDVGRDARTFAGGKAVIAHPPCGPWGRMKGLCTKQDATLGPYCVRQVRRWGGVLEHPAHSGLWTHEKMPPPGFLPDAFGGITLAVSLNRFGATVHKPTWLYIVGADDWPAIPPSQPVTQTVDWLHSSHRHITPEPMARWLIDIAQKTRPKV